MTTQIAEIFSGDIDFHKDLRKGDRFSIVYETLEGDEFRFGAGRYLRFFVRDLTDAKVMIKDLGSYWEAILGTGRLKIWLSAGGDVTLVTDQAVKAQPPHYMLGNIERPTLAPETTKQD